MIRIRSVTSLNKKFASGWFIYFYRPKICKFCIKIWYFCYLYNFYLHFCRNISRKKFKTILSRNSFSQQYPLSFTFYFVDILASDIFVDGRSLCLLKPLILQYIFSGTWRTPRAFGESSRSPKVLSVEGQDFF